MEEQFSVCDLSKLEAREIAEATGGQIETQPVPSDTLGEPTLFTVTLGLAAISAFVKWSMRKRDTKEFTYRFHIRRPDGTVVEETVTYSSSMTLPPEEAVLAQLRGESPPK